MANIVDLSLGFEEKTPVKFNKNDDCIVYVNLSDTNISGRLSTAIDKLVGYQQDIFNGLEQMDEMKEDDVESVTSATQVVNDLFNEADKKVRDLIDEIFNAPVSAAAAPDGNMWDVFDGSYRFEYILEAMTNLYADTVKAEYAEMSKKISKHTNKYKKHPAKGKK